MFPVFTVVYSSTRFRFCFFKNPAIKYLPLFKTVKVTQWDQIRLLKINCIFKFCFYFLKSWCPFLFFEGHYPAHLSCFPTLQHALTFCRSLFVFVSHRVCQIRKTSKSKLCITAGSVLALTDGPVAKETSQIHTMARPCSKACFETQTVRSDMEVLK